MLTGARYALATVALAVAVVGLHAGPASADPVACAKRNALTGICLLVASTPGTSEGSGSDGEIVPVVVGGSSDAEAAPPDPCTYVPADPQPPESHPVWQGRTAADGSVYLQVCPRPDGFG